MPRIRPPAPTGHKHCRHCEQVRPVDAFAIDASKTDGLMRLCRTCDTSRRAATRHAAKVRDAQQACKEAAREKRRERDKSRKASKANPHGLAPWAMSLQNQRA